MNTDRHGFFKPYRSKSHVRKIFLLSVFIYAHLWLISSCSSKATDVRTVVPADSLVYLETNDLGKALHAVTDNDAFRNAAKTVPDFSVLDGIKLAVAVTGFETTEQPLSEENSVLNFQPRFVAIAETNGWNYQAISFAENKLGEFINEVYGGEVQLERFPRFDGDYFIWTAQDGRKAYGLVIGSLIFFGNDETAIEKCIAVRKGEADPISKNAKIPTGDFLSSGYVSSDGVAQLANIVGIQLALAAGEEEEVKSFIARVLPEILRNSVKEMTWTTVRTEQGIEDSYSITTSPEVAQAFSATLVPAAHAVSIEIFAPANAFAITRYNLENLRIGWRSLLLTAQTQTDPLAGSMIAEFSNALFEPYGIVDPEQFLDSVRSSVITARLDEEGEKLVVIAAVGDYEKMKKSISKEIDFSQSPSKVRGEDMWQSKDGTLAFARQMGIVLIGNPSDIQTCIDAGYGDSEIQMQKARQLSKSKMPAFTIADDARLAITIAKILSENKAHETKVSSSYRTETSFNKTGIQRQTVSNFGLIGSIIEQFGKD